MTAKPGLERAQAGTHEPRSVVTLVYRHPLPVRLFHWINAACFVILLMSGLLIFNTWPKLYLGHVGNEFTKPVLEISGKAEQTHDVRERESWLRIGNVTIPTTGVLGAPQDNLYTGVVNYAFPSWLTIPQQEMDLGHARGWHFLFMWIFAANVLWYGVYLLTGRLWRVLLPTRDQLMPRAVLRDIWRHLRFQHVGGWEAVRYNLLQKLAYLGVLGFALPLQVLSGLTMSPTMLSIMPFLIDLFGGRQTARTVHFAVAMLLALFLVIHLLQVFVAGFWNEMRSIVTGYFVVDRKEAK